MAIIKNYINIYREIFKIDGIFSDPFLMVGFQDITGDGIPDDFKYKDFKDLLVSKGIKDIETLDMFDGRADLKYDLNFPVPEIKHNKYSVVFDIGTLEHIFDTRQCLENCLRMVRQGGLYTLVTPINGYYNHGFHVFNPVGLVDFLKLNGFEILYSKFCTREGEITQEPWTRESVNIFLVARKIIEIDRFKIPQQAKYSAMGVK